MFYTDIRDRSRRYVRHTLELTPTRFEANEEEGFTMADLTVIGSVHALGQIAQWIGNFVDITNRHGDLVWTGVVQTVQIDDGRILYTFSSERLYNAVAVRYSYRDSNGDIQDTSTDWATDDTSIDMFGRREYVHSAGRQTQSEAETLRDDILEQQAYPAIMVGQSSGYVEGQLQCQGLVSTLAWINYEQDSGLAEVDQSTTAVTPLGYYLADDDAIGMTDTFITDIEGRLAAVPTNSLLHVYDSYQNRNDGYHQVTAHAGKTTRTYANIMLSFDSDDDLYSTGGIFTDEDFEVGVPIRITDSNQNDGHWWMETIPDPNDGTYITVDPPTMQNGNEESATLQVGDALNTESDFSRSLPRVSTTVKVSALGSALSQRFSFSSIGSWTPGVIAIPCYKVGNPADGLRVRLYSDNSGEPGTLLTEVTLGAANIDTLEDYHEFTLSSPPDLSPGTVYHLYIDRTGATSLTDFYAIGLATGLEEADYGLLAYQVTAWVEHTTVVMPFRLEGRWAHSKQITEVLSQAGGVFSLKNIATTTTTSLPYRDDARNAYDEFIDLVRKGRVSGTRLVVETPNNASIVVRTARSNSEGRQLRMDADGNLTWYTGAYLHDGVLPIGEYIEQDKTRLPGWAFAGQDPGYIAQAAWETSTRRITWRNRAAPSPDDIGGVSVS